MRAHRANRSVSTRRRLRITFLTAEPKFSLADLGEHAVRPIKSKLAAALAHVLADGHLRDISATLIHQLPQIRFAVCRCLRGAS
jgi:hypothetical protein